MTNRIVDTIELVDGRFLTGIIDFISNKQIYFFDFTRELHVDYLLLAILWKGYNPDLRFSVFITINYPDIQLPRAILIPTANIKNSTKQFTLTKKPKQRKKTVRLSAA